MIPPEHRSPLPFAEFVAMMAMMMSLVALSIDAVLPALPAIGSTFDVANPNDVQLVVTVLFLGIAIGQFFYGPLSDSLGRKPVINIGMAIFVAGGVCVLFATSFEMMLIGRLLEGLGLGAPRIVSLALIRDVYEGRTMARVMSFVVTIFILVPMIAPLIGQGVLWLGNWQAIFVVVMTVAIVALGWFNWRQPETLPKERRRSFSPRLIFLALVEIVTNRVSMGYTLVAGLYSAMFLTYLSSVQQVLGQQYGLGDWFAIVFASLAAVVGAASSLNARIVQRIGMRKIVRAALTTLVAITALFALVAYQCSGHPPFWSLLVYLAVMMFCSGLFFGNTNAVAMEPLGHIAGIGAAVVGSLSTLIAVPLAIGMARAYDGAVTPLILGFLACTGISLGLVIWVGKD